jgi:hypothetical protein
MIINPTRLIKTPMQRLGPLPMIGPSTGVNAPPEAKAGLKMVSAYRAQAWVVLWLPFQLLPRRDLMSRLSVPDSAEYLPIFLLALRKVK